MVKSLPDWLDELLESHAIEKLCREVHVVRNAPMRPAMAIPVPGLRLISCMTGATGHVLPGEQVPLHWPMTEGATLVVDKNLHIAADAGAGLMFNAIFGPGQLSAVLFPRPQDERHRRYAVPCSAWPLVQDLFAALISAEPRSALALHLTRSLWALAIDTWKSADQRQLALDLTMVTALVDELLPAEISRPELAKILNVHPNHLSRLVAKTAGESLSRLILRRRLLLARRILASDPDISLACLAAKSGFSSPSYFSQSCRRLLDIPPSELRSQGPLW